MQYVHFISTHLQCWNLFDLSQHFIIFYPCSLLSKPKETTCLTNPSISSTSSSCCFLSCSILPFFFNAASAELPPPPLPDFLPPDLPRLPCVQWNENNKRYCCCKSITVSDGSLHNAHSCPRLGGKCLISLEYGQKCHQKCVKYCTNFWFFLRKRPKYPPKW